MIKYHEQSKPRRKGLLQLTACRSPSGQPGRKLKAVLTAHVRVCLAGTVPASLLPFKVVANEVSAMATLIIEKGLYLFSY